MCLIAWIGLRDTAVQSDMIVVLGNRVEEGGIPSERLRSRLDRALWLYQAGQAPVILVSGGPGRVGVPEAEGMKNYLLKQGVPETAIVADYGGVNTYETARNTESILKERDIQKVLVVSNYYHIVRIQLALARRGVVQVSHAHAYFFEYRDLYALFREFVAIGYYRVRPIR